MTATPTLRRHLRRHRPPRLSRATVRWMGSPLAALLALCLVAPQARAAGSKGEDLPRAASTRAPAPPLLPVRGTDSHHGSPPASNSLQLADLRDPFAPTKLKLEIPPGPYPIRVADLKDPFDSRRQRGRSLRGLLLPGDLRDPFRPRPPRDKTQPGTLPCWPPRTSTGVIIQRPRSLRETAPAQECETGDGSDMTLPDLRDPFPAVPRMSPDHKSPIPVLAPDPVAKA